MASTIIGIQFGIMSPEEIRKSSVAEITTKDTYINNKPVVGGIFDPRMGVLEPGMICPTDKMNYIQSPGYFGHIELVKPVFYIQYLSHVLKVLKCVCFKCSKLLVDRDKYSHFLDIPSKIRWDHICELSSKIKRCGEDNVDGCGFVKPTKIKKEGLATIYAEWKQGDGEQPNVMKLTSEMILSMFKRITDQDVDFLGFSSIFSRPEWMICEVLAIPPPCVRPSVKHDSQQRSEDDLSHIIICIIKANTTLKEKLKLKDNEGIVEDTLTLLQYHVASMINNKIPGIESVAQRSSGRIFKSITERLNGKVGRIRGNLMGKRVDYSARSVITGDPNLSIEELGVPLKIAMNITYPAKVNDRNIHYLTGLMKAGPDSYPGAKILEKKTGEQISLRYVERNNIELHIGDTVHRHILDGDFVLFNRQPTLHRMSMMCHRVKVLKVGNTFRMNVADTKPYNADFDGDEMNMHMPQNAQAVVELKHLAAVKRQIISPATNSSIVGIFQDSLLGLFMLLRENISFNTRNAMNLLVNAPMLNTDIFKKRSNIKNTDIISEILPPISLKMPNTMYNDGDNNSNDYNIIEINNGKYLRGHLDKNVKHIIHSIFNDFGYEACANFIDSIQNIVTEYMKTTSYSVGISDLIADKTTNDTISKIISDNKSKVSTLQKEILSGTFNNNTNKSNEEEFESKVNGILNKAREDAGTFGRKSLDKNNRFVMMVNAGSKGSNINIAQMISCLGQQNIDGKRIPYGFEDRTLPHYKRYDDSPEARGFVESSFIKGLTPQELFFHAMGGRVGLIDTAVKTSQTGYIQRRLIKGLEDLKIEYDMTVRNNHSKIIQFRYGDDCIDTTKAETQKVHIVSMSIEEIYAHFQPPVISSDDNIYELTFNVSSLKRVMKQTEEYNKVILKHIQNTISIRDDIVKNVFEYSANEKVYIPVHFKRIINNVRNQLGLKSTTMVNITPLECIQYIERCKKHLDDLSYAKPTPLFYHLMEYYLTPRELLFKQRFTKKGIQLLCVAIETMYKKSIVNPGEMVGMIAAQSIGEPTTQMTLNTFHFAGVSSKSNVTRGVPRIEEILSLSKEPKNVSITLFLKEEDQQNKEKANYIKYMIENTVLRDIVSSVQICFDPDNENSLIEDDLQFLEKFHTFEKILEEEKPAKKTEDDMSKWVIRFEMNKTQMLEHNITMDDIHFAIKTGYPDDIQCIFSDYNEKDLVFRIRLQNLMKKKEFAGKTLDQSDEIYKLKNIQEHLLDNIILKGIKNIKKVYMRKLKTNVVKEEGHYNRKDIWVLDTVGTNLKDILSIPNIDQSRTYTNDIIETYKILGIEATRNVIFREIMEVLEFDGSYINSHHVELLCDRMCLTARLISIFRHGINNDNIGPIAKASFEETTEMFLRAARHGEVDTMKGVSANIMCGQEGYYGTSSFRIYTDIENLKQQVVEKVQDEEMSIADLEDMIEKEDSTNVCNRIVVENKYDHIQSENYIQNNDDYNPGF